MTPQPLVTKPPSRGRVFGSVVWALLPLLSLGVFTPVVFVIAWIRRRTFTAFFSFISYSGLFVWVIASNDGPQEQLATNLHILILWLFATAHCFVVRQKTWYLRLAVPAEAMTPPVPPVSEPEAPTQHMPPSPPPTPAAETPRQREKEAPAEEPQADDPILGRIQDEPVIALVAQTLIDAPYDTTIPLARFEQRFFGNFRPDPEALQRFVEAGTAQLQRLAETDPDAATAAHRRAETILAELGAEPPTAAPDGTATDSNDEHAYEQPGKPEARPESAPPETAQPEEAAASTATLSDESTLGKQVCDSETYRIRIQGLRRFPDSSVVAAVIDAAHNAGGVLTAAEVGRIAGRPTSSVDGYVSQLQRALNIDGAQVLAKQDDGTAIRLDLELLRQQFLGGRR